MYYLLKASGIVVILFLFYIVFLKNETFFKSIRGYFLAGLIIVISIPLIEIPVYIETASNINMLDYEAIATSVKNDTISFDLVQLLTMLYIIGVAFFSIKFLIQLSSLLLLLSKHSFIKKGKLYYIETTKNISPFSFFNIIIYNKSNFNSSELKQIINHEKAHVSQWHSLDTILSHLLVITLWFNPFVWLYKKAVQQNLEFLADSHALKLAENHKLYQLTLLKTCGANYCTEITNNFYNSLIKKRIIMIHKNKSTSISQWKYLLLVPVFIAFVLTFNTKIVAQEKKIVEVEKMMIELIIDKNSSDINLTNKTATFKTEANIDLSFKGVKRNLNHEIIAIKIEAKGEGVKAKFENSGTEPIKPIKISFNSDNNSVSIGNVNKIHKNDNVKYISEEGTNRQTIIVTEDSIGPVPPAPPTLQDIDEVKDITINIEGEETNHFSNPSTLDPLLILNGKEISKQEMDEISPDSIKSLNVLKGESAIKKYGEKGKNGIIEIITK